MQQNLVIVYNNCTVLFYSFWSKIVWIPHSNSIDWQPWKSVCLHSVNWCCSDKFFMNGPHQRNFLKVAKCTETVHVSTPKFPTCWWLMNACRKYYPCSPCCCTSLWVLILEPYWSQDAGLEIWSRTASVIKYCDFSVPDFVVWLDSCSTPIIWKSSI